MNREPLVKVGDRVILLVAKYRGKDEEAPSTVSDIIQTHAGPYLIDEMGRSRCAWRELGWRKAP